MVVENEDERHLRVAAWAFPLYLLLISMFVVPIAAIGLELLPAGSNPDLFVLTLPLSQGQQELAMLSFLAFCFHSQQRASRTLSPFKIFAVFYPFHSASVSRASIPCRSCLLEPMASRCACCTLVQVSGRQQYFAIVHEQLVK